MVFKSKEYVNIEVKSTEDANQNLYVISNGKSYLTYFKKPNEMLIKECIINLLKIFYNHLSFGSVSK